MKTALFGALAVFTLSQPAMAVTTIYAGQDDGVGPGGSYVNSNAAEASFLAAAAAFGTVKTDGFESAAVGYYSPLDLDGVSITYSTANFGPSYSGVSDTMIGTALYGFNVTPGGSKWLGFPDFINSAATFTFDSPTKSFGFYLTGVQALFTSAITLQLLDGSMSTFYLPLNTNGGVTYFGITDTTGFTAVFLQQTNYPGYADAYGIDNISFNDTLKPTVPEPATWAMLITGFGLVGVASRRRGAAKAAA